MYAGAMNDNDAFDGVFEDDEPAPVCDLCDLVLELVAVEINEHAAVSMRCLLHGERRTWEPFGDD